MVQNVMKPFLLIHGMRLSINIFHHSRNSLVSKPITVLISDSFKSILDKKQHKNSPGIHFFLSKASNHFPCFIEPLQKNPKYVWCKQKEFNFLKIHCTVSFITIYKELKKQFSFLCWCHEEVFVFKNSSPFSVNKLPYTR